MNFYEKTYPLIQESPLSEWMQILPEQVEASFDFARWGDLPKWFSLLDQLPSIKPSIKNLNADYIQIGQSDDCDDNVKEMLELLLHQLTPWRKGPYDLFGVKIDSEWRSDLKWNRLINHIQPLKDKYVLDVGCGNGYHCWRMSGEGAKLVIGVDPTISYIIQHLVISRYIDQPNTAVFPVGVDQLPRTFDYFDTVFSMGLLYHRRSPIDHLYQLKTFLKKDGELVLDTLVIDNDQGEVLTPTDRYAQMKNVWFIPSLDTLELWMKRVGYKNVRIVDVNQTTSEEQRVTPWIGDQSLQDFLDPIDSTLTIEGYPAPKRAIVLANK